ncbi:hypothetical protein BD779DRAFT_1432156, partial [Infundibulicybe gibba]
MLRKSTLEGFRIEGEVTRLITTLFADDTTVYLAEQDSLSELNAILDKCQCEASGAKFNTQKTVILPVGTRQYRERVIDTRKINPNEASIPEAIQIAGEEEPVRILGAYVGNGVNQSGIWVPTLEKIDTTLKQWSKSHPTIEGRRLIVGMEVGGRTQYLTRVQGMPTEVEQKLTKMIRDFIWPDSMPAVNMDILHGKIEMGGRRLLNIKSRNEAIELMKAKTYLQLDNKRSKWPKVADGLIRNSIPDSHRVGDKASQMNMFLQNWSATTQRGRTKLPESLIRMLKTMKKYKVAFAPVSLSKELKGQMPMWHH